MAALPVGDKTLSAKEIVGNESQERMGMIISDSDIEYVQRIAQRERAPFYVVGETTNDNRFTFEQADGVKPIDLAMADMFGNSPKTILTDNTVNTTYSDITYKEADIDTYLSDVLSLEAVACKDWLTNKSRPLGYWQNSPPAMSGRNPASTKRLRSCFTRLHRPPRNCNLDRPCPTSSHDRSGQRLSNGCCRITYKHSRSTVGRRPKKHIVERKLDVAVQNPGEDAALYKAVEACSDFACSLGINIPTGKDSLSMTQKYGDDKVFAPALL